MSRYMTTHNAQGKAVFSNAIPTSPYKLKVRGDSDPSSLEILYTSHVHKPDLSSSDDIEQYTHDRTHGLPQGQICPTEGFATSLVTMGPGESPMHRTMTLDVVMVLEGELELRLDSGETKVVKMGDTIVQRGTMHQWRNVTPDGGLAKLMGLAVGIREPLLAGGRQVGTEWVGGWKTEA